LHFCLRTGTWCISLVEIAFVGIGADNGRHR
jgi:hypothetical protein